MMDISPVSVAAYAACAILIAVYAWGRFNTPSSNRSSTRQALYWWSGTGYVLCALAMFGALSFLFQTKAWCALMLGSMDNSSLPAPLIATLALTTLLPSVPMLKRVDAWLLQFFLDWGAIPGEVKRRAAGMTPTSFSVTEDDVAKLRDAYGDGSYGDTVAEHIRAQGAEGLEHSQFRFTQVVKLYDAVRRLASEPRYERFFSEAADDFAQLEHRATAFMRRSDACLTLAVRLRAHEGQATYDELMRERREAFGESCRDMFRDLALFLARAVLRSEASETDIVRRLRSLGFPAAEPRNVPDFPIHALTLLALGSFLYLFTISLFYAYYVPNLPQPPSLMAFKIALVRVVTVGSTVWLIQRYAFFRRRVPGEPWRFFAYAVCGMIASAITAPICLFSHLVNAHPLALDNNDLVPILWSGILCAALALCCDDWPQDTRPPRWLRLLEAAGCASVMALGGVFMDLNHIMPIPSDLTPLVHLTFVAVLPAVLALIIGGWVPHIYRSARLCARARQDEARQEPSAAAVPRGLATENQRPTIAGGAQGCSAGCGAL